MKVERWRIPHSLLLEINKWNGFNFFFLLSNSLANSNAIIAPKLCPFNQNWRERKKGGISLITNSLL